MARGAIGAALLFPCAAAAAQAVETTITSAPPAYTNSPNATFAFEADSSGASFQCRVVPADFSACTSPHTLSGLGQGEHTFEVRALASTGGPDPTPASHTWTTDYSAPETVLHSAPPPATNSTTASFQFSSPDASAGFQCSLNGSPWAACSSPWTYAGLSDGTRTFSVRAVDAAANVDTTPPEATWSIDTVAPDTGIHTGPPPVSNQTMLWFTATEPSTFECSVNSGLFLPCSNGQSLPGLVDGPVTVHARAMDAVGNLDPTPAVHAWTLDRVAPSAARIWVGPRPRKKLPKVKKRSKRKITGRTAARAKKFKVPKVTRLFQKSSKLQLRWGRSDEDAVYDVRRRRTVLGGGGDADVLSKPFLTGVQAGKKRIVVPPGTRDCFTVRARDAAGNESAEDEVCARVPYTTRGIERENWARRTGKKYFEGQYAEPTAAYPDNRIIRTFYRNKLGPSSWMSARAAYLVVTRCLGCDKIRVAVSKWQCISNSDECYEKAVGMRVHRLKTLKTKRTQFLRVWKAENGKPVNIHKIYVTALGDGKARVEGFAFR